MMAPSPDRNVGLQAAVSRAEDRVGRITITGRYHRPPRKLENDYTISDRVLGSGYNGEVLMAKCKTTGADVAVKAFKLLGVSKTKRSELESEAEIFLGMDHPHVARLVDVYESPDKLNLVMECMKGGELFERVTQRKRFSEKDAAEATYQMLLAVNYLHKHGVVHRDIKLENFLYESKDGDHLKLIDFGFSKIWAPNTTMAVSCGTLAYVAPEVLENSYTSQCDLWSLGVVVFILLFGYMPFSGSESKQIKDIKAGIFSYKKAVWDKVSSNAQDFVRQLLVVDPKHRMTAQEALDHKWLTKREHHNNALDQEVVNALCNFGQASAFRRACMSMMAWSLSIEERQKVRDAFLDLDKSHKGAITLSEFKQTLESQFHINDDVVEKAFKALDASHHDEIHYSEFLAAMVASRIAMHDDLLRVAFRRFDTDNSGFITVESLKEILGETFEGANVEQMMLEADVHRHGKISYEEWIEYLKGSGGKQIDDHTHVAAAVIDSEIRKTIRIGALSRREGPKMTERHANASAMTLETREEDGGLRFCGPHNCSVQ